MTTRKYTEFVAKKNFDQNGVNQKNIGNVGLSTEAMKSATNLDTNG